MYLCDNIFPRSAFNEGYSGMEITPGASFNDIFVNRSIKELVYTICGQYAIPSFVVIL